MAKKLTPFILLTIILVSSLSFGQLKTNVKKLNEMAKAKAKEFKIKHEAALEKAEKEGITVRRVKADGNVMELQYFIGEFPIYYETENYQAAVSVNSDKLWENGDAGFNLSGEGITLGVWDGGAILTSHVEFGNRVTVMDNTTSTSSHSTHVGGTIGASGVDERAKGMSYKADIHSYSYSNDESEMTQAAADGLRASNHSYGVPLGWESDYRNDGRWAWIGNIAYSPYEDYLFGFYSSQTRYWDNIAYNAPYYLIIRSAGNERTEDGPSAGTEYWINTGGSWQLTTEYREPDGGTDGYDCIQHDKIGKNILTVGAVHHLNGNYTGPQDVVMSDFSSWGNPDDGRVKPDLSAVGVNLYSTTNSGNTAYTTMSGTSMSTPNTTGSVGLVLQYWKENVDSMQSPLASTLKALLLNNVEESGDADGPDYKFGWGLLNTYKAVENIERDVELGTGSLIKQDSLDENDTREYTFTSDGIQDISVTLCWTDPAGNPVSPSLNPDDIMLINDLDLRIIAPDNTEYFPWMLDHTNPSAAATKGDNIRDNVEKINIKNTQQGEYKVRVNHKGTLTYAPQYFSVVISGAELPAPTEVTSLTYPAMNADTVVLDSYFQWTRVERAQFYNIEVAYDSNFASIALSADSVEYVKYIFDNPLPGDTTLFWRVKAGNYQGMVEWSNTYSFKTRKKIPDMIEYISPENDVTDIDTTVSFHWIGDKDAEFYKLEYSTSAIFSSSRTVTVDSLTDTTYTAMGLEDGEKYYWRVTAYNSAGISEYTRFAFFTKMNLPTGLAASATDNGVMLSWTDNSSNENNYYVERKDPDSTGFVQIAELDRNSEEYTDEPITVNGLYTYRIYAEGSDATSGYSDEVEITVSVTDIEDILPKTYSVSNNYPNPFNPSTNVTFTLPEQSVVTVRIFNVLGELVDNLYNGASLSPGKYNLKWNAVNRASGMYILRFNAKSEVSDKIHIVTKKMLFMK